MSERGGFDHVGVIAPDLAPFIALAEHFGLTVEKPRRMEALDLDVLMIEAGGARVEVLAPAGPDSRAAQEIAEGRAGVHHMAFRTPDAAAALERLAAAGFDVLDSTPREGFDDSRIGFARVGPALVEVVQHARRETTLTWQVRTYRLYPDKIEAFRTFWRDQVVPLRRKLGFVVAGGWLDEPDATFTWIVGHEAPDGWEAVERAYYDSPLREGLPDPRQFVASLETRLTNEVLA